MVFDPDNFFEGIEGYAEESVIEQAIELLEFPENYQNIEIELLTRRQRHGSDFRAFEPADSDINLEGVSPDNHESKDQPPMPVWEQQLLTPDPSDAGDNEILDMNSPKSPNNFEISQERKKHESSSTKSIPEDHRTVRKPAPHEINLNPYDKNLIITGKRNRKPACNPNIFAISIHARTLEKAHQSDYLSSFANEISKIDHSDETPRIHQSQLPPPPRHYNTLGTHAFGKQFLQALHKEWNSLREKGCFRKTDKTKITADAEVLPLMWVFSYKTGENGFLASFKARLVVRGDLEEPLENTYAATLAIRNFRVLVAIANYFNLELRQYDVPTAFLNAKLDRKLYAKVPEGVQHMESDILEVLRALYGLKESPLLWYKELKAALLGFGLKDVPGFTCLYINHWLILFVYVDDIVMAYHKSNAHLQLKLVEKLVDLYNLKEMCYLAWLLGIRIIRDRT